MDPAKMKVVDLRSELGALGLDTKGNKPALVERLRKALEAKSGKVLPDTSILDTTTEDLEDTPRRPGPASRTTRRRSSSTKIGATPAKIAREEPPRIEEESLDKPDSEPDSESSPQPQPPTPEEPQPIVTPEPEAPAVAPQPVQAPQPVEAPKPVAAPELAQTPTAVAPPNDDMYSIDDDKSQSPLPVKGEDSNQDQPMEEKQPGPPGGGEAATGEKMDVDGEDAKKEKRELTEEEEWALLNERLKEKEKERLEREKAQAEADAKKFEELAGDPVRLNRLKRKHEKKQRWSNFYRNVEVTNDVLTPPTEEEKVKKDAKKEATDLKIPEPEELDDDKVTLSWYDSDLNQYLELPELNAVVPLSEAAFAHAWAGVRATHGVTQGRVCFEVRVGAVMTTTESAEKEPVGAGIRVGWSTTDSTLHLGEGEHSWGYESSGRLVNNGEFKEYGKELKEKDVLGAYLDLDSSPCKMVYTVNGAELGVAYEFDKSVLDGKPLFPHVLTKNTCYKVNFGYERYSLLTRTKIVRKRIEIPVEQVLEEKKKVEEELRKQKEEAARKEKERKEALKKEKEERQRKKREERQKQERERKEKEIEEKRARGEDVTEDLKKLEEKSGDQDKPQPQENGEKANESMESVDKDKSMETDASAAVVNNVDEQEPPAPPAPAPPAPPAQPEGEAPAPSEGEAPAPAHTEGEVPEVTEEQVLKGHVLDKRIKFVTRYLVEEELDGEEACLVPGYVLIGHAYGLVPGPRRPATLADCEVILMVGLPGSGKTYWATRHAAAHPDKRYNLLSTGALFEQMKVDCKPYKATFEGRWDSMVSKAAKCVQKLMEIAKGRRRNYILDQTNVYPSAQRRKLKELEGYRRRAVVVVPPAAALAERRAARDALGKEVPDPAVMDMKANFTLPEKSPWLDEVTYAELDEEEAKKVVEEYHSEAKAAGVGKERRDRSASRDAGAKRPRSQDRRRRDDRRSRDKGPRDREDRWGGGGGGGGGGRWGPARGGGGGGGGGGGRFGGGRDRHQGGGGGGGGGGGRDRWGPPQPARDFGGRDRDGFRGGRGAGGGGGGDMRGGAGGAGRDMRGGSGGRGPPPHSRFGPRDDRAPQGQHAAVAGGGGGGGGGSGSWQRGGQGAPNNRGAVSRQGPPRPNQKDGAGNQASQQQQAGWNQWAGGWGGWGNWNQNQAAAGWGNWGNWGQWPNQQQAGAQGAQQGAKGQQSQQQQQWPANYTAQQWYQWQQWQQQQQGWPGYQGNQAGTTADAQQQAWAQYYQNYGGAGAGAGAAAGAVQQVDKK